jgi:hypothetical protein
MSDETTRPGLWKAIEDKNAADDAAAEEARQPERKAFEQSLAADAKLYGTAGWDALPSPRRQQVAAWVARQAHAGGDAA